MTTGHRRPLATNLHKALRKLHRGLPKSISQDEQKSSPIENGSSNESSNETKAGNALNEVAAFTDSGKELRKRLHVGEYSTRKRTRSNMEKENQSRKKTAITISSPLTQKKTRASFQSTAPLPTIEPSDLSRSMEKQPPRKNVFSNSVANRYRRKVALSKLPGHVQKRLKKKIGTKKKAAPTPTLTARKRRALPTSKKRTTKGYQLPTSSSRKTHQLPTASSRKPASNKRASPKNEKAKQKRSTYVPPPPNMYGLAMMAAKREERLEREMGRKGITAAEVERDRIESHLANTNRVVNKYGQSMREAKFREMMEREARKAGLEVDEIPYSDVLPNLLPGMARSPATRAAAVAGTKMGKSNATYATPKAAAAAAVRTKATPINLSTLSTSVANKLKTLDSAKAGAGKARKPYRSKKGPYAADIKSHLRAFFRAFRIHQKSYVKKRIPAIEAGITRIFTKLEDNNWKMIFMKKAAQELIELFSGIVSMEQMKRCVEQEEKQQQLLRMHAQQKSATNKVSNSINMHAQQQSATNKVSNSINSSFIIKNGTVATKPPFNSNNTVGSNDKLKNGDQTKPLLQSEPKPGKEATGVEATKLVSTTKLMNENKETNSEVALATKESNSNPKVGDDARKQHLNTNGVVSSNDKPKVAAAASVTLSTKKSSDMPDTTKKDLPKTNNIVENKDKPSETGMKVTDPHLKAPPIETVPPIELEENRTARNDGNIITKSVLPQAKDFVETNVESKTIIEARKPEENASQDQTAESSESKESNTTPKNSDAINSAFSHKVDESKATIESLRPEEKTSEGQAAVLLGSKESIREEEVKPLSSKVGEAKESSSQANSVVSNHKPMVASELPRPEEKPFQAQTVAALDPKEHNGASQTDDLTNTETDGEKEKQKEEKKDQTATNFEDKKHPADTMVGTETEDVNKIDDTTISKVVDQEENDRDSIHSEKGSPSISTVPFESKEKSSISEIANTMAPRSSSLDDRGQTCVSARPDTPLTSKVTELGILEKDQAEAIETMATNMPEKDDDPPRINDNFKEGRQSSTSVLNEATSVLDEATSVLNEATGLLNEANSVLDEEANAKENNSASTDLGVEVKIFHNATDEAITKDDRQKRQDFESKKPNSSTMPIETITDFGASNKDCKTVTRGLDERQVSEENQNEIKRTGGVNDDIPNQRTLNDDHNTKSLEPGNESNSESKNAVVDVNAPKTKSDSPPHVRVDTAYESQWKEGELVWVTQGKTDHMAKIIGTRRYCEYSDTGVTAEEILVQWTANKLRDFVLLSSVRSFDMDSGSRRRRGPPQSKESDSEPRANFALKREGDSAAGKQPKKKQKKRPSSEELEGLFDVFSENIKQYLSSININNAEQLLTARTADIAEKLPEWREHHGLPELKGRAGAKATASGWKGRVRQKAASIGATELANMDVVPDTSSENEDVASASEEMLMDLDGDGLPIERNLEF